MALQAIIATFDRIDGADQALKQVQKLDRDGWLNNHEAAVLVHYSDGSTDVHDTEDVGAPRGALAGALTGGLVGLLAGPVGSAVGLVMGAGGAAMGAAVGATSASLLDMGLRDDDLQLLSEQLEPGTSALAAVVEPTVADKIVSDLYTLNAQIVRREMRDELVAELRDAPTRARQALKDQIRTLDTQIDEQIKGQQNNLQRADAMFKAQTHAELDDLRQRRETARAELRTQYTSNVAELTAKRDTLRSRLATTAGDASARLQSDVTGLQVKLARAYADMVANSKAMLRDLQDALAERRASAEKASAEARARMDADAAALGKRIEQAQAAVDADRKALDDSIEQAKTELQSARLTAQADDLAEYDAALESLQAEVKAERAEVEAERAQLHATHAA